MRSTTPSTRHGPPRFAIYRRVSTKKQASEGASLDQQLETCTSYAAREGGAIVADYVEAGRSAFSENLRRRPAFQQMLADARAGRFDVVLVYDLSRFARRQRIQFSAAGDLESVGVRVVSVTEPIDPETIEGFVTYSVLAMQAELHSRLLSRRITAVRAREAAQGQMAQKPARGLRWVDGRLVWDETEAPIATRAYALAGTGLGTPTVLAQLRREGHHISLSSLHYLLNNPAYIGMLRHRGQLLPAAWPPLIDRALWDVVQAFRRARHPKNAVRATVRSKVHALLAGLAFCANCGAKLHYEHHQGRRHYYTCSCHDNRGHCIARPSRADQIDGQIETVVLGLTLTPAVIARARALVCATPPAPPPSRATPAERLRRLARAYADGAYTDEEYEARRAAIQETPTLPPTTGQPELDREAALATAVELVESIPAIWAANAIPRRRALLSQLVTHVYARRHVVYAIRPTRLAEPLFQALWDTQGRATSHCSRAIAHRPILLAAA